jgi:hypothetical protein
LSEVLLHRKFLKFLFSPLPLPLPRLPKNLFGGQASRERELLGGLKFFITTSKEGVKRKVRDFCKSPEISDYID